MNKYHLQCLQRAAEQATHFRVHPSPTWMALQSHDDETIVGCCIEGPVLTHGLVIRYPLKNHTYFDFEFQKREVIPQVVDMTDLERFHTTLSALYTAFTIIADEQMNAELYSVEFSGMINYFPSRSTTDGYDNLAQWCIANGCNEVLAELIQCLHDTVIEKDFARYADGVVEGYPPISVYQGVFHTVKVVLDGLQATIQDLTARTPAFQPPIPAIPMAGVPPFFTPGSPNPLYGMQNETMPYPRDRIWGGGIEPVRTGVISRATPLEDQSWS